MRKPNYPHKNILAVFTLEDKAGREILMGCLDAMINKHDWSLFLREPGKDFTADHVLGHKGRRYDGFIISMPGTDEAMAALARSSIPTVLIDITDQALSRRTKAIATLWGGDSMATGQLGARHLFERGPFASYAFVHELKDRFYSYEREVGFRHYLKSRGVVSTSFKLTGTSKSIFLSALKQWILDLPKPAGIMTCSDMRAEDVVNICRRCGLDVPNQVSVIGVDDDQVISMRSPVSISTITPDFFKTGTLAVQALERLFKHPSVNNHREIVTTPKPVIPRESTGTSTGAHALVEAVRRYVQANATRPVNANDVAKFIGRSRQLIDLRCRQCLGTSLHAMIESERMTLVQSALKSHRKAVVQIAKDFNFTSANQLSRIYKRHFGHTISQARYP